MNSLRPIALLLALTTLGSARAAETEKEIFNGKDLTGWEGNPMFWSVRDGALTGQSTPEKKVQPNTFLVWKGGLPGDFELHLKYRFATPAGNSGIQFRSKILDPKTFRVGGYQADFDAKGGYDGSIYDEAGVAGGRGTMSNRGEKTVWDADNKHRSFGERARASVEIMGGLPRALRFDRFPAADIRRFFGVG